MAISPSRNPEENGNLMQSDHVSNARSSSFIAASSTIEMSISASDAETESEAGLSSQQTHHPLQSPQKTQLFDLSWSQADEILDVFRQKYMHHFPSVVLENGISACQVEQQQPFTFKAIMLVATPLPLLLNAAMKESFFAHLGQRLFTEKECDLDLLQCVLVCVAWYI